MHTEFEEVAGGNLDAQKQSILGLSCGGSGTGMYKCNITDLEAHIQSGNFRFLWDLLLSVGKQTPRLAKSPAVQRYSGYCYCQVAQDVSWWQWQMKQSRVTFFSSPLDRPFQNNYEFWL